MKRKWLWAGILAFWAGFLGLGMPGGMAEAMGEGHQLRTARFTWDVVPGGVEYEFVLMSGPEDIKANVVHRWREIYTNGVTLNLAPYRKLAEDGLYWKVCALDFHGNYLGRFCQPKPLAEDSEMDPEAPLPTTEFEEMDYMPLYPVFSWIPQAGARYYEVKVYRETAAGPQCVRVLSAEDYDVYDYDAYTEPGSYYWQVRAVNDGGRPTSSWSEPSHFRIETPTPFAALGDSITHGGGAVSVPQSYLLYDWETYSDVPVKNLGLSGNTTEEMLERFEDDVLPWKPRVLVIMGGVNDFRVGVPGTETVNNLIAIREKCNAYGIIPVFATVTPINPEYMVHRVAGITVPPDDWQMHFDYINDWVKSQQFNVDVTGALQDENGELRQSFTTDGLHPDYYAKKYMGETIGNYLQANFAWVNR